eukprot:2558030-Pyramimonas_sp.AAC.1
MGPSSSLVQTPTPNMGRIRSRDPRAPWETQVRGPHRRSTSDAPELEPHGVPRWPDVGVLEGLDGGEDGQ